MLNHCLYNNLEENDIFLFLFSHCPLSVCHFVPCGKKRTDNSDSSVHVSERLWSMVKNVHFMSHKVE